MKKEVIRKKFKTLFWNKKKEKNISAFSQSENFYEHQEFILDSGATNWVIKAKKTFVNLDKNCFRIINNANKTQSSIVKGDVEFFARNKNEGVEKMRV